MYVTVSPCLSNGQALDEDSFIEEPDELLGKPYYFKVSYFVKKLMQFFFNCADTVWCVCLSLALCFWQR